MRNGIRLGLFGDFGHFAMERASIAFGFEQPAIAAGEHGMVEHHTLVPLLPVECYNLNAFAPEDGRIEVRRGDAHSGREGTHHEIAVVREEGRAVALVHFHQFLFRQRKHVGRDGSLRCREVLEVVAARVNSQCAQCFNDGTFLLLFAFPAGRALILGVGGRRRSDSANRGSRGFYRFGSNVLDLDENLPPQVAWAGELLAAVGGHGDEHPFPSLLDDINHYLLLLSACMDFKADYNR